MYLPNDLVCNDVRSNWGSITQWVGLLLNTPVHTPEKDYEISVIET